MRLRNTVIAFIVLLLIGGYAFVNYYFAKPVPLPTLLGIKSGDITRIDLKYPNRELIIQRSKPDAPWMLVKPMATRADQDLANNLAHTIANCHVTETVAKNPRNLAQFGLKKPKVTVFVTTVAGKKLPGIEVGKVTPVGFKAYIKLTDKPVVMLTASTFPPGMNKTVDELRNHKLMDFKLADVTKFTLQSSGGPLIEIDRKRGGKWKIVKPATYAADQSRVNQLLTALANSRITSFINDSPTSLSPYGLDKPRFSVTVYTGAKGASGESLMFGSREPGKDKYEIFVRRGAQPAVYSVESYLLNEVDKTVLDLRDRTVLSFKRSTVDSIAIDRAGKSFTLKRAPHDKWTLTRGGKTSPADASVVKRFLGQLHDLKGQSIVMAKMVHPEMFGMVKPACEITLAGKDGKPVGTIKLSSVKVQPMTGSSSSPKAKVHMHYYAVSTASPALFDIDHFTFGLLDKSADYFLPPKKAKAEGKKSPASATEHQSRPAHATS